jgi:hypothetical protein
VVKGVAPNVYASPALGVHFDAYLRDAAIPTATEVLPTDNTRSRQFGHRIIKAIAVGYCWPIRLGRPMVRDEFLRQRFGKRFEHVWRSIIAKHLDRRFRDVFRRAKRRAHLSRDVLPNGRRDPVFAVLGHGAPPQ